MIDKIVLIIILTFLPTLELRFSIPYGIYFLNIPPSLVIPLSIISNIVLGMLVYLLLDRLTIFFLRYSWFKKIYYKIVKRTQKKVEKYVNKYGVLGLAIFISIPLPGSGSWTGALGAHILGMRFKKFVIANLIGVIIAGILVSLFWPALNVTINILHLPF
jgi:uncharacterized membrane protein